ncbi:NUDIX domain-containing protein (plasmid) [Rhizobium ruizarguesonis]|uniref:Putative NUDIX hydrolase n=1 Tax=Rhizobium leguminosarum TaxID=384 RepID=A0A2K9ZCA1_RHILE|nr:MULTISPECIES: NUDIX domain-containing protein [Rhizobium]AUW45883.1 putative NUDIX hydrolase [Rhizobium leguminosarum]TBA94348.1 NUDIX domain-containing protein [Rhizobium ruizarguesonis]
MIDQSAIAEIGDDTAPADERLWVSVGAAVYDQMADAFLLIQREDNGRWELPGGLVEAGERLTDAVIRETKEETGADVIVVRPSGLYESPSHRVISVVFACTYIGGALQTSSETRAVKWVPSGEIESLVNGAYSCRLLDFFAKEFELRTTDEVRLL